MKNYRQQCIKKIGQVSVKPNVQAYLRGRQIF